MDERFLEDDSLPVGDLESIDDLCLEFETAWKLGHRPRIESYLSFAAGRPRLVLLRELLLVEIEYRLNLGERPAIAEYHARFAEDSDCICNAFAIAFPVSVGLDVVAGPHQGRRFLFHEHDTFWVGRGSQAHVQLPAAGVESPDEYVSRYHFVVEVNPPLCRLTDCSSTNGTFVNRHRVQGFMDLNNEDMIRIGKETAIRVSIDVPEGMSEFWQAVNPNVLETLVPEDIEAILSLAPSQLALLPADYADKVRSRQQPFPGYLIVEEIGSGGMGVVYLAIREDDQSVVALKSIAPSSRASKLDLQRFLREANILRRLNHPCIVAYHEMGEADGRLFFVMDYVSGTDARSLVKRSGPLSIGRAVGLACQLLEALQYAHAAGFVHRDIKPANLLVASLGDGELVKLADFGLARAFQNSRLSGLSMTGDDPTATGEMGGTPRFMAPEQITQFRDAQPSVDQYSAAATLYYLLTGQYLYDFPRDMGQQLLKILNEPPIPIRQRRADIPVELEAIIHRALARKPQQRFADVAELRRALAPLAN